MEKKANFAPVRNEILERLKNTLKDDYDILITGGQEFTIPITDADGNEGFATIKVAIPKGSHDGTPYDGYAVAEDYKYETEEKAAKAAEAARAKAAKIARDAEIRAQKAAEREAKRLEREAAKAEREAAHKGE